MLPAAFLTVQQHIHHFTISKVAKAIQALWCNFIQLFCQLGSVQLYDMLVTQSTRKIQKWQHLRMPFDTPQYNTRADAIWTPL